jgi:heptosyltransferase III
LQRVLFITLSNIGDVVLTTPVLERLHQCYPEAVIDILTDARAREVLEHCPYRGDILLKEKRAGWRGLLRLVRALRRTRYEAIVDLRTDGLAYLLRARRRYTKWGARPLGAHAVEDHMGVIAALGGAIPPTRIWLDDALRGYAAAQLAALPGQRWLALGPGANWPPKIWAAERFRELVSLAKDAFDAVILLGGPNDRERAAGVAGDCALPCLNLCGDTSLLQAAAVLAQARVFVGNDSGLGHLASAVGTPTLTVFGPGRPLRYHPWGPHCAWIVAEDQNLDSLTAHSVAEQLRTLLEASAHASRD